MAPFSSFESVDDPGNHKGSDARTEHDNHAFTEPRRVCGRVKYNGPPSVYRVFHMLVIEATVSVCNASGREKR